MARKKSDDNEAFGRAVQEVRIERGLSREAFAGRVELDPRHIEAVERGEVKVRYTLILRLARGLDIQPVDLLARAGVESIRPAISVSDQRWSATPAAIAGVLSRVLCVRAKL
jgi:transcriptional regulator with XRE-family HTH domain